MAVELALTPDSRWDIGVAGLVTSARDAGFSALGVNADRVRPETASLFASAGLRCHEILAHIVSSDEARTLSSAGRVAEAADAVRAQWVLTVFRTGLSDTTAKVIQRCAAMFREAGAGMAVEFSPFSPVSSIPAGLEVVSVAAATPARAGILIDTWHFSFGDSTWDDLAGVPLERIAYVQFTDGLSAESDDVMHETMNRRAMPGEGVLELDRFASGLLERGWEGVVSVEVLSNQLSHLPVAEFARLAYDTASRYWT